MSDHDEHPSQTMRAMSATASWLDRLGVWGKRGALVLSALVVLRGVYEWGETAYNAVGDVGPHLVQFRAHVGDYEGHLDDYQEHEAAHQVEHGEFHELGDLLRDSVVPGFRAILERVDTVRVRQDWILCVEGQERDREAGRPIRACTPLGPLGGGG